MSRRVVYRASPTLAALHESAAFYRGIRGPVGSGKSTGMCMEIMRRAHSQAPGPDGLRRTRFAVVRNTYRELRDTTLKTWFDWFPAEVFGALVEGAVAHRIRVADVATEILFRALDKPQDVAKVLSLELTGAWVNEAREVPKGIVDALGDRVGRYPARKDGGCTWRGVIMDTNAPDEDHWWYRLAEEERPQGWKFFGQPGGLTETAPGVFAANKQAENLANLEPDYYETRAAGKSVDHIRVYYCGRYGFVKEGKPVFPEYRDEVHCAAKPLVAVAEWPLYVGLDFGLTPAAVFAQRTPGGQWRWLDEVVTEDMGAVRFAEVLGAKLRGEYGDFATEVFGDPSGDARAQTDERTVFDILNANGIAARPAPSNDPVIRREAVATALTRMIDGEPGFAISPTAKVTRRGLGGGYCYRRVRVAGEERFHDKPDKNRFSHPVEAGEYAMLGAGEGHAVIRPKSARPWRAKRRRQGSAWSV